MIVNKYLTGELSFVLYSLLVSKGLS